MVAQVGKSSNQLPEGGYLGGQSSSDFVSEASGRIQIEFWGDGIKAANILYYPKYLMIGIKIESGKDSDWVYSSYVPKWVSSSIPARNSEGELLLQPDLPADLLVYIRSILKNMEGSEVKDWSYTATRDLPEIDVYNVRIVELPNITMSVQYFPEMKFYRWVFGLQGRECNWSYVNWPQGSE